MDEYKWKGLMIDVARHMPSSGYLMNKVDEMHALGLNRLHLHLSDDQGFRFESRRFPKLNEVSSFRNETAIGRNFPTKWTNFAPFIGDGKRYGGYYSQIEISKLVSYAASKGILVVPEIDIPGHMSAILAAYPEFAHPGTIPTVLEHWGVFSNVLANNPSALGFICDLFSELSSVFQTEYIHIGGDEVPANAYGDDINAQKIILKSVVHHVQSLGHRVVLWDEASDVAIDTAAIVMNWRKLEYGIAHLQKGGSVIFCLNQFFYFDYYQKNSIHEPLAIGGYLPNELVAGFKLGSDVIGEYSNQILGIQANLWTEYMQTEQHMDYMLYPRLTTFSKLKP